MKEKFLRILSPITLTVIAFLDLACICYAVFAIKKLMAFPSANAILFFACDIIAIIVAALVTKESFSNGIKFYDDELEFTMLDNNNIYAYSDIVSVETKKDTKASFTKNFIDRQSKLILTLKNEMVITIDIGLTTKGTLEKCREEIESRL